MRKIEVTRKTKETDISVSIVFPERTKNTQSADPGAALEIDTGIPFFDHMMQAMLFHGGFGGEIRANGDTAVDDHHTVEDVGIVLGTAFRHVVEKHGPVERFGHGIVPMDDALGEVVVDAGGRSYLVYRAEYPQERAGTFDLSLVREFFQGFASQGNLNVHVIGHYALNGHHLAEALFKAAGRALGTAFLPRSGAVLSTKGVL